MIALIVARPGALRDGLTALLSSMPEITVVGVTASLNSALDYVAQSCPSVVLLQVRKVDTEHLARVQALKAACPQTKVVALAEQWHESQDPGVEGVEVVLRQGMPPARLTETLSELLAFTASAGPPTGRKEVTNLPS